MQPWDSSPYVTHWAADEGAALGDLPPSDARYWRFYEQVAQAQLTAWLPARPSRILDLSAGRGRFVRQMLEAGHTVVHVVPDEPVPAPTPGPGRLIQVRGDIRWLGWLRPCSVDAVLAERRELSRSPATELAFADIARALRPGGRLLAVVDSLQLGLARLAHDGRWAELADVPAADVVLVPDDDGTVRRCFRPDELRQALVDAGLTVDWIRPRTVLSPATVEQALRVEERRLATLVQTELTLAAERQDEAVGNHLVASCRRPD